MTDLVADPEAGGSLSLSMPSLQLLIPPEMSFSLSCTVWPGKAGDVLIGKSEPVNALGNILT